MLAIRTPAPPARALRTTIRSMNAARRTHLHPPSNSSTPSSLLHIQDAHENRNDDRAHRESVERDREARSGEQPTREGGLDAKVAHRACKRGCVYEFHPW